MPLALVQYGADTIIFIASVCRNTHILRVCRTRKARRATAMARTVKIQTAPTLGDKRTGRDLRDTIKDQLVTKYMASDACRSGCLLVTVNRSRGWEHPDSGENLNAAGLELMLQTEASKVVAEMGGVLRITARVLDLRPRLSTEANASSSTKRSAAKATKPARGRRSSFRQFQTSSVEYPDSR